MDVMYGHGVNTLKLKYFLPPYEWYNDSIAAWTKQLGLQLINYTPGTLSHADYTTSKEKTTVVAKRSIIPSLIMKKQSRPD
jgi:peptidoglycan/xylan/chitin deacetylase (PgdA/CDA1 family)